MSTFVPNKVFLREFYCTTLFKTNLQLKHIEFLSRLMVTMLCQIRHAETGFAASKIMILNLRNCFKTFKSVRNDLEARTLCAV